MIDLRGTTLLCEKDCPDFIAKWEQWWAEKTREPVALIECVGLEPLAHYLHEIGGKSRNMVSKANRLYDYRRFKFNDRVAEIEAINRSKPVRAGGPMIGWYTQPVTPVTPARLCGFHADEWYGGFRKEDDVLVGYVRVEVLNELGIFNSILGHKDAPAVMNGLIAHLVEHAGVRYLNYLFMGTKAQSLTDFKASVGFKAVTVT